MRFTLLLRPFAVAAMLLPAAQGAAQLSPYPGRPGERPMPVAAARAAIQACGNASLSGVEALSPQDVGLLAYGLQHPGWEPARCVRRDPDAALAMLEAYAGDPIPLDTGSLALARLSDFYRARPADRRAQRRLDDILRILWLRGYHHPTRDDPLFTPAERERLLSDPDNLAFLRFWVAGYEWDGNARNMLARGLLLENSPLHDPVEAASVIHHSAPLNLRLRLLLGLLANARTFGAALEQPPRMTIHHGWITSEDARLIEAVIANAVRLFEQGGEPERTTGARVLAALAEKEVFEAQGALRSLIDRNGCCLVMSGFPLEAGVRPLLMSNDDYPDDLVGSGMSGTVRLEAYFGPDGRLLYIDGGGGEPSSLRRQAIALWRRRSLQDVELRGHRGSYVRIAGPTIIFRMPRCELGVARPMPPPDPDVVTVDGPCFHPRMF